MKTHREVEEAADRLRSFASGLTSGSKDPEQVASRLRSLADDLEDLAKKLKRAAQGQE